MSRLSLALAVAGGLLLLDPGLARFGTQPSAAEIQVLDAKGAVVNGLVDGATVRLRLDLHQASASDQLVQFDLAGSPSSIASCPLKQGAESCETESFTTLGWYWSDTGNASPTRTIAANVGTSAPIGSLSIQVRPRPVVMVHGFSSTWEAWTQYLGPSGYLTAQGLAGFAVGDGQAPGAMRTGDLTNPAGRTNTIAENAAVLSEYIQGVKKATGAEQVDLIAHSMGGLIARYYIDRVMGTRDVAQLLMLGSPMAGTDCADLPAALGLYLPATLEIRPSYVTDVFNLEITHRHGVPFRALAGVPILDGFKAPCTDVPSDLAVSLDSVTAIPLQVSRMPVLHTNLNLSEEVFHQFVLPLLKTPAGSFPEDPDPQTSAGAPALQFSRVFTGHVDAGEPQELVIPIDSGMVVASFALYDTSRSLDVSVIGASGNPIELSPEANGLVVLQDPATLFYLGYGFPNPRPGEWRVTLSPTEATKAIGADFALAAHFSGGAQAEANVSALLPRVGEAVTLTTSLGPPALGISLTRANASIRQPGGALESLELGVSGSQASAVWAPDAPGLYGIDVELEGTAADGMAVERTAFLAVEAQPVQSLMDRFPVWPFIGLAAIFLGLIVIWAVRARNRRGSRA